MKNETTFNKFSIRRRYSDKSKSPRIAEGSKVKTNSGTVGKVADGFHLKAGKDCYLIVDDNRTLHIVNSPEIEEVL